MRRTLAAVTIGAALAASWLRGSAAEDVVTKVGWWTANPLAQAPEGGGAVQRTADGSDITLTAVRVQVPVGELQSATLVLIEDGGLRPEAAALQVCVSGSDFEPVAKGARNQAPAPDCDGGSAVLARASTGTHWSAEVAPLLAGRPEVTLMVLSAGPGAGPPVGYEVRFRRPSVEVAPVPTTSTSMSVYEPPPLDPPPLDPPPLDPPPMDFGGVALPTGPFAPQAGSPSGEIPAAFLPPPADTGRIQPLVTVPHDDGKARPWGRLLGFAPVSALAGIVAGLSRRALRRTTAAGQVA